MDASVSSARRLWVPLAAACIGGALLGVAAKLADLSTVTGVADLGTYLGLWVLLATLIAAWSPTARDAAVRVGICMLAMVTAYYLATWWRFGIFPVRYFLAWAGVAVLFAPLFALVTSRSRQQGWLPAMAASLPIGLLLSEAYVFRWGLPRYLAQVLFDLAAAGMLLVALPRTGAQRVRVAVLTLPAMLASIGLQRALPWMLGILYRVGLRM
jgi:hypothetical protein